MYGESMYVQFTLGAYACTTRTLHARITPHFVPGGVRLSWLDRSVGGYIGGAEGPSSVDRYSNLPCSEQLCALGTLARRTNLMYRRGEYM